LPFADGSFDVVMSTFGAMFAPDQQADGGTRDGLEHLLGGQVSDLATRTRSVDFVHHSTSNLSELFRDWAE
jgi:hypothetical protein